MVEKGIGVVIKRMLKMNSLFIIAVVFVFLVIMFASTEEPFCNNKCHNTGMPNSRICHCDKLCATIYDDCCGDSEHLHNLLNLSIKKRNKISCNKLIDSDITAYRIVKCSSGWKGPEFVRNSCERESNYSTDPIMGVPVTDALTGTTYKNYHCAICNEARGSASFWKVKIVCPTMSPNMMEFNRQEVIQYIFYNETAGKWGFSVLDEIPNRRYFHSCHIRYVIPKTLEGIVRRCDPELVSACSPTWKDDAIQRFCHTYVDPVYSKDGVTKYRNLYCAICNRIDMSQLSCGMAKSSRQNQNVPRVDNFGGNFAVLLDVDTRDGNKVGEKELGITCTKSEVFDPFVKKCRNIVCGIPGFTLRNGKCVRD